MKKSLIIILIIVVVGIAAYLAINQNLLSGPSASINPSASSMSSSSPLPSGWQTYRDSNFGFEISYPADFVLSEGGSQNYDVGEFFVGSGQNVVTISFSEDSYLDTNFLDGFLTVSISQNTSEQSCRQAQREGDTQIINLSAFSSINNLAFWRGETSGAAAGTLAKDIIYHVFLNGACYEITENLFEGNIGNYPPGTVTQVNETEVFNKMDAILATFRPQ